LLMQCYSDVNTLDEPDWRVRRRVSRVSGTLAL